MRIRLIAMQGMWPRREPRLLEDRQAQIARDTRLLSGAIQSYREPVTVEADVGLPGIGTQDIWRWRAGDEDYWFRFPSPVEVVRGPVAGDVWERVYWTGDSRFDGPRYTYTPAATTGDHPPVNSYRLGVPQPRDRLTLTATSAVGIEIEDVHLEQPIRVTTKDFHGFQDNARVKFDIEAVAPTYPPYDATKSYVTGDRVVYDNKIYEATSDIERNEEFIEPEWASKFVFAATAAPWSPNESYKKGDRVTHGGSGGSTLGREWEAEVNTRDKRFSDQSASWLVIEEGVDVVNGLAEFLNADEGFQITVEDESNFTINATDAVAVSYTTFEGGTVAAHFSEGQDNARFYTYTYVTEVGEEGPPAAPSRVIVNPRQPVQVQIPDMQPGISDDRILERRRIYRTTTGLQGSEFRFVDELDISEQDYTDEKRAEELAERMPSARWDEPPDGLRGLETLPTGIVIGFFDQEVCFSEPYRPHAWPVDYRLTLDEPIVALGVFDTSVVAATRGRPYLITGSDPRSMQPQRLDVTQGCVSRRSLVSLGYAVVYASPEGLVQVSRNGANIVTAAYMTADEWSAYAPDTIHAYEYEGRYIGFYDHPDNGKGGFIFDPREPEMGFQELGFWAVAGYRDATSRSLFLLDENTDIVQWDAGELLRPYLWRSKRFQFPYDINVSAAYVVADSYDNLTFRLYAHGVLRFSVAVASARTFRLPAGYRARDCEVEVEGTDTVQEIVFGEHAEELAA